MFTPSRAQGRPLYFAGISSAPLGRSRMWPKLDSTTYPDPRKPAIIRAFFGDSTITSRRPAPLLPALTPAAPATALLALLYVTRHADNTCSRTCVPPSADPDPPEDSVRPTATHFSTHRNRSWRRRPHQPRSADEPHPRVHRRFGAGSDRGR